MKLSNASQLLFLKSALVDRGDFFDSGQVVHWLRSQNEEVTVKITPRPVSAIPDWHYDRNAGRISHQSGKFFSIEGIQVNSTWGMRQSWQQPIINQPEIGFLGIITKEFNGVLHFLLQAKIEPGNLHHVQLSPTLQATRSNYTQVHQGRAPLFLDYFRHAKPSQILLDQLQSEQGARFLRKRNRNIIIKIDDEIPEHDQFVWLTLAQIKTLMRTSNLVNMDTRTVLSGISYGDYHEDVINLLDFLAYERDMNPVRQAFLKSALTDGYAVHGTDDLISFMTRLKSQHDLDIKPVPLKKLNDWIFDEDVIRHKDDKFFRVIAVDVEIGNREVVKWSQPMIQPAQEGLCALVAKNIHGIMHFAVQAKLECGNHDIIEFAPTVQCLTGNYRDTPEGKLPFLEYVLSVASDQIVYDTLQSEEGGRFYREQNRNMIIVAGDEIPDELPPNYIWMTLNQLLLFLRFNNYLNIQIRSLISAISFI